MNTFRNGRLAKNNLDTMEVTSMKNGSVVVFCKFYLTNGSSGSRTFRNRYVYLTFILKFSQIAESYLINQFTNLLESQVMADVKLIVKGEEMAAHATILAAASPVFATMFEPGKFEEGQSKNVEIDDIEPEVFQQLLRYVYTGTAPKLEEETITEPLFLAADKYQMDKIKERCKESLIRKLSLENAVRYLVMAHLHSAGRLQEASIQFLVGCRNEIWDRPEWKKLIDTYPELFYLASRRMVKNT
jgi:speckle-type POZ protein